VGVRDGVDDSAHELGSIRPVVPDSLAERTVEAIAAAAQDHPDGLVVVNDALTVSYRRQIAEAALKHRLPSICALSPFADAGGLITYGPNLPSLYKRAAVFVDRILKGAKPADIPIEQPTRFELRINLNTAKALGITIPQPLLLLADEVIE